MKTWIKCLCATAVSLSFAACGGKDDEARTSILEAPPSVPVSGEMAKPQMLVMQDETQGENLYSVTVKLPTIDGTGTEDFTAVLSGEEGAKINTIQLMYKGDVLDANTYARALGADLEVVVVTRYEEGTEGYYTEASYDGVSYVFVKDENSEMVLIGETSMDKTNKIGDLVNEIKAVAAENQVTIAEAAMLIYAPEVLDADTSEESRDEMDETTVEETTPSESELEQTEVIEE